MFVGHIGAALIGKRVSPSPSLGTYVLAGTLVDLLLPVFVLLGWERIEIVPGETRVTALRLAHYPWSHSLLADLAWAVLFIFGYWVVRRSREGALTLGLVVLSHWVLDFISHEPDLQITPWSSTVVGLSLWNSVTGTALVEGGIFVAGVALYLRGSRPQDRIGRYAFAGFVVLFSAMYAASLRGSAPPSVRAFVIVSLIVGWSAVIWAYWVGRHRAWASRRLASTP